jgi:hypothetical protein
MKKSTAKTTASQVERLFEFEDQLTDAAHDYCSESSEEHRARLRQAAREFGDLARAIEAGS